MSLLRRPCAEATEDRSGGPVRRRLAEGPSVRIPVHLWLSLPVWVRACCAWGSIAFAGLIVVTAGGSARADLSRTLPDVPRFKLFASSHATAAAEVLAYGGVKKGLPEVVLIGGLEGRIYRCDCGKGIDL